MPPARLSLCWTAGALANLVAIAACYPGDVPSGPAIVVGFGAFLVPACGARGPQPPRPLRVVARAVGGAAALGLIVASTLFFEKHEGPDLSSSEETPAG